MAWHGMEIHVPRYVRVRALGLPTKLVRVITLGVGLLNRHPDRRQRKKKYRLRLTNVSGILDRKISVSQSYEDNFYILDVL